LAVLIFVFAAAPAEAQLTRGAISGTVRDATGAVVPGAAVTVTNIDTNISRSAVSDALGFYRVPALEPGRYRVVTELSGFTTVEFKDIRVVTAQEHTLNVELNVAGVGEAITVTGQAEAVQLNKSNPTIGLTSTARQAVELPLSAARNINNLIALSPNALNLQAGTSGAGGVAQGGFAVNGQRSRNNNYMIDGSDNNDIAVTISTTQIVPETVAEFQVLTNPYNVEFGRNSGAQINVITKSGTNRFRGDIWDYYTTNGLASLNNIEKASNLTEPSRFIRHQMGVDIGGPLIKDKTFFYGLYQRDTQRPGSRPGATVRIPTPAGFAALQNVPLRAGQSAASRQAVLQRIAFLQDIYAQGVVFRNLANTLVNGVAIQTGQTNVPIVDPSTYHTFFGRLDHRISASDSLTIRYSLNDREDLNAISNCTFGALFCGFQDLRDTNLALGETHMFGSDVLNEFRFSWVKRDLNFPENDPDSPTAGITGLFTIGGASNFPQFRISDSFQFQDVFTWTRSRHTLKFGADIRYNKLDNFSAFNSKGTFTFNNLQDYMNNTAAFVQQALQTSSFVAKQWQTFLFAQDDFRITPDLTVNLGLRYEISGVPLGFFGATDPQVRAALVPGPVKKDKNNWAPRVGFAWSPRTGGFFGNGKTVIRGGYGIGYDILFYNLLVVNASNFPRIVTLLGINVQDLYPNKLTGSATPVFNPLATFVNSAEDTQNPSSQYYSFDIQREIGDFIVWAGYSGSRGYHGINQIDMNPAILTPAQAAAVRAGQAIPGLQARRLFPQFGSRVTIPTDTGPNGVDAEARSTYNAAFISLQKRLSHGLQFGASYTYSRWYSNNDASLAEAGTDGSSQRPQDYFDYAAEWSRSQFDRPHRFVVNYIYEIPGPKSGVWKQVLNGWQFSGVTQVQSGRPFTVLTGVDSNGDGNTGSDRPNVGSGSLTPDPQTGNLRSFTNPGAYVTPLGSNNLPLANAQGNGSAGRNSERGPGFANTDLALIKRFWIGESQLHLRVDMFNAFNQDSYGNPNATMTSPSFGQNGNNWGRRTVLLSAKFTW
jgi:hypothetical protein